MEACLEGHLEIVRFLLTDPSLARKAVLKTGDHLPPIKDMLYVSFCKGHKDVVEFLCTSSLLQKRADIFGRDQFYLMDMAERWSVPSAKCVDFVLEQYKQSNYKPLLEKVTKMLVKQVGTTKGSERLYEQRVKMCDKFFDTLSEKIKCRVIEQTKEENYTPHMREFASFQQKKEILNEIEATSTQRPPPRFHKM